MTYTKNEIDFATGFCEGDKFRDAEDVRRYFDLENLCQLFEQTPDELGYDEAELTKMANTVIENGWHMITAYEINEDNIAILVQLRDRIMARPDYDVEDALLVMTALVGSLEMADLAQWSIGPEAGE